MDDEEYNPEKAEPGTTQIPLIHDLVFDPSLPLKSPGSKVKKTSASGRKQNSFPPGYDPDTMDLFADLVVDAVIDEVVDEVIDEAVNQEELDALLADASSEEPATCTPSLQLRTEITAELSAILADMKEQPLA